jgi:hypothetical protein
MHIGLPRGCLDAVLALLQENDIRPVLQDECCTAAAGLPSKLL